MKKIVCMLLSLCMLVGLLAGCGDKGAKPEDYKFKFLDNPSVSLSDTKDDIIKKSGLQERSDGKGYNKDTSFTIAGIPFVYLGVKFNDDSSIRMISYDSDKIENTQDAGNKIVEFLTSVYGSTQEDAQALPDQVAYWKFTTDQGQSYEIRMTVSATVFISFYHLT